MKTEGVVEREAQHSDVGRKGKANIAVGNAEEDARFFGFFRTPTQAAGASDSAEIESFKAHNPSLLFSTLPDPSQFTEHSAHSIASKAHPGDEAGAQERRQKSTAIKLHIKTSMQQASKPSARGRSVPKRFLDSEMLSWDGSQASQDERNVRKSDERIWKPNLVQTNKKKKTKQPRTATGDTPKTRFVQQSTLHRKHLLQMPPDLITGEAADMQEHLSHTAGRDPKRFFSSAPLSPGMDAQDFKRTPVPHLKHTHMQPVANITNDSPHSATSSVMPSFIESPICAPTLCGRSDLSHAMRVHSPEARPKSSQQGRAFPRQLRTSQSMNDMHQLDTLDKDRCSSVGDWDWQELVALNNKFSSDGILRDSMSGRANFDRPVHRQERRSWNPELFDNPKDPDFDLFESSLALPGFTHSSYSRPRSISGHWPHGLSEQVSPPHPELVAPTSSQFIPVYNPAMTPPLRNHSLLTFNPAPPLSYAPQPSGFLSQPQLQSGPPVSHSAGQFAYALAGDRQRKMNDPKHWMMLNTPISTALSNMQHSGP